MSESLSWMQTGDTQALSGELDQDVLLPLWEMREEAVKGITCIDLSRVSFLTFISGRFSKVAILDGLSNNPARVS